MRIESINTEHTTKADKVAFNLSSIPSDYFRNKLLERSEGRIGSLKITLKKGNDWLLLQCMDGRVIDKESVKLISDVINQIHQEEKDKEVARQRELAEIGKSTGVKLDTTKPTISRVAQ